MAPASPSFLVGLGLVVASSLTFALNTTLAVLSYHDGATPISLGTVRVFLTMAGLYLFLRLTKGLAPLSGRDKVMTLALGILMATQAWLLLTAIGRIPIGLAILTLYIYPILMALGAYATGEERPSAVLMAGLVVAFAGLALALDVMGGSIDPIGIGCAALGALVFTIAAIASAPIIRRCNDASTVTYWMHIASLPIFAAAAFVDGAFPLPGSTGGWAAFLGVALFYTVAMVTFFAAMVRIGAVRTGLVMNLEPILALTFGYLVFGQALTPIQLVGVALVLLGVSAVRLQRGQPRPAAAK
jgi:drug/metabolite transporter (DMT)-like permease